MPAIQLREFTTGAEVIANAKAVRARIRAYREPVRPTASIPEPEPKLAPMLETKPLVVDELIPFSEEPHVISIIHAVCRYYQVEIRDFLSARRFVALSRPRHIAMYLCKRLTLRSFPDIGRRMGNRDHTTVIHGVQKIASLRLTDATLNAELMQFEAMFSPPPPEPAVDPIDPNQLALPFGGGKGGG